MTKNYYRILGVLDDAEDIVIRVNKTFPFKKSSKIKAVLNHYVFLYLVTITQNSLNGSNKLNQMKIFFFALVLLATNSFASGDRIALVVGNSKYSEFGVLANPVNDARDINKALAEIGYKTRLVLDANESTIRKEFRNFAAESDTASIAVVFYAGHGAQVNGENYLLPVDMDVPKRESDIQLSALKIDDVISSIKSKTKVIFLDACRDNPALIKSMSKGRGSYRGGLAPTASAPLSDQSSGVFIAYATDAGSVASDGLSGDKNSPFTSSLLRHIKQPVSIDDMFSMVTKDVRQKTNNSQKPYKYASLDGVVCLPGVCKQIANESINSVIKENKITAEFTSKAEPINSWTLFQRLGNPNQLIYIDLNSIQLFGSRVSTRQKWVRDTYGSYDINYYAFDCKSLFGNIYRIDKYESSGKLLSSSAFGNPQSVNLKFDYTHKQSVAFTAMQISCSSEKSKPIVTSDNLHSQNWERFFTIKQGVELSYLKGSIKSANSDSSSQTAFSFLSNLTKQNPANEQEVITKLTFPRTIGSDMKSAINVDLGLSEYVNVPYATTLVSKTRFICGKNTSYQVVENWFDQDGSIVGITSAVDVELLTSKDKLIPNHSDSILNQLSRFVCS
jgi:hypothetical protein